MAAELILVLKDFFYSRDDAKAAAARPRLPALETLLASASRRATAHDWRAELAARFGDASQAGVSVAGVVAQVWLRPAVPPAAGFWLATPVHYFAGLDSVHLHPAGLLELSGDVQARFAADFNAVFGDTAWRLHANGSRELLLAGPALGAGADDPARYLGSKLEREQTRGTAASELRRLAVEVEMWLHEHPINRARQAAGELPVTGLWFWGSEALAVGASAAAERLYGRDTFAEALWRLRGGACEPIPERFSGMRMSDANAEVVLYPIGGIADAGGALERFECDWLSPALAALRAGTVAAIELFAGGHAFRLRRLNLARFWRARLPWAEALV